MKIIFLGTNGWYTSPTGNTPCVLIDSKTHYVIFDAGNGIYKLDEYIKEDKPIALFISHFHIDHVSGLHTLAKFNFPQGIDVYLPKGRKKDFDLLVAPPFTIGYTPNKANISNLATPIRVHELAEGEHTVGFNFQIIPLYHAYKNHGYRVRLEDKVIAYSGDTRVGPNSYVLAGNADVLIHECASLEREAGKDWGHVNSEEAAELAKKAKTRQLILTHFGADLYKTKDSRSEAEKKARKIFPNTIAAHDGMVIEI